MPLIKDIRVGDVFHSDGSAHGYPVMGVYPKEGYITIGTTSWDQITIDHALRTTWSFRPKLPRHLALPHGI
jgi:hypothetical protein